MQQLADANKKIDALEEKLLEQKMKINAAQDELTSAEKEVKDVRRIKSGCKIEDGEDTDNEDEESKVKVEEDNKCNRNDGSDKKTLSGLKRKESSTSSATKKTTAACQKTSTAATNTTIILLEGSQKYAKKPFSDNMNVHNEKPA